MDHQNFLLVYWEKLIVKDVQLEVIIRSYKFGNFWYKNTDKSLEVMGTLIGCPFNMIRKYDESLT